jgi:methyl-accepting chemotaxis protein
MSPFNLTRFNVIFFTAVVAALVAAGVTYETGRATTISDAFSRLTLFHGLRKATVEDYMLSKTSDMKAMSRNDRVIDALSAFNAAWSELPGEPANEARRLYIKDNPFRAGKKGTLRSANDGSGYTAVHREFHDWARRFLEHFGYYDLFLIDASGNVVYSAEKEDDYAPQRNAAGLCLPASRPARRARSHILRL